MEHLQRLDKLAENMAVAFKLAAASASLFENDAEKVRLAEQLADNSKVSEVKFSFKHLGSWLKYKKALHEQQIRAVKLEAYVKNKLKENGR